MANQDVTIEFHKKIRKRKLHTLRFQVPENSFSFTETEALLEKKRVQNDG